MKDTGKKKQASKAGGSEEPDASKKPEGKSKAKKGLKKTAPKKKPKPATKKRTGEIKGKADPAKRVKKRTAQTVIPVMPVGTGAAELDPFEVAKQTMKGSVPAIVESMVKRAKAGSCTHAKTLLEMTGAKHMFDGEAEAQAQENGEPWAKLVLKRLDEAEAGAGLEGASGQEESLEFASEGR